MRLGRLRALLLSLSGAIALHFAPAAAGQQIDFVLGRGAEVVATLSNNAGSARVFFVEGLVSDDTGVAGRLACIEVTTASGTDFGCSTTPTDDESQVNPLLNGGQLIFTVPSTPNPGGELTADITLSPFGQYDTTSPLAFCIEPLVPGTCTSGEVFSVTGSAQLVRGAVPGGSVSSSTVGGGLLEEGDASLFEGASGTVAYTP